MKFEHIALQVPEIYLPCKGVDLTSWAVVACDQYTSQPEYWENVRELIGTSPSTLNLILPEVYLEADSKEQMIQSINSTMREYLDQGILTPEKPGFILLNRKNSSGISRKGLIVALDLEQYDYSKGAQTLIRATEGTILERLPPRIQVRENAPLELPHIMVLIDDPDKTVIEPLFDKKNQKVYDVPLMMNSGHIQGYKIEDEATIREVAASLGRLADLETYSRKYNVSRKSVLLYALGDGNHSFATAKVIWENLKKASGSEKEIMHHPARYVLVELVNVHDEGLEFEPIHRVVFNINTKKMIQGMESFFRQAGSVFSCKTYETRQDLEHEARELQTENTHLIPFIAEKNYGLLIIKKPVLNLEVATLQAFFDTHMKENPSLKIDYIHGTDAVTALGSQQNNIGFYLPAISKHSFFKTIILDGALPRKTFSMGEADDKRFYLECRRITKPE
ncbi:MAG: DUF1015 domain-containing protein [Pseudomonadota bacterium]